MKSLLVYYGYLNSFNSASHGWDNLKLAKELAQYNLLVIGDGLQDSAHADYANTKVILPKVKELNPSCEVFGYVTINQSLADFKSKVDDWGRLDIDAIFLDEAGYDYGTESTNGRAAFNERVDYCHEMGYTVMANAWKPEHVLSSDPDDDDASYLNKDYNPHMLPTSLDSDDWYMLESFAITSAGAYESKTQWHERGAKAKKYDVKICALSVVPDATGTQAQFDFIFHSALAWDLDAVGSSDTNYGASSAKTKMWTRPDYSKLERQLNSPVVDPKDSNKYLQYNENGKIELDFTSGSESSTLTIY